MTARENDFDAIIIAELESLRAGEKRLELLYPQLRARPQLRGHFVRELVAVQQRADRLNDVLRFAEC